MKYKIPKEVDYNTKFHPDSTIDFHIYKISYPYEVERILNEFIEDSYVEEQGKLLVITGKGEVVRPAAAKVLEENQYVREFRTGGYFNGQDGVFEVKLVD